MLVYPIRPGRRELGPGAAGGPARAHPGGRARDRRRPGTSQLAPPRRRVSVATASEHAATLRAAGLITTRRDGAAVRHCLTPLGEQVLLGGARPVRRR
ncbi:helix-turn-helix domain-containing protein [Micromonospora sp. BRA006-A]|nr:helix-turn-helix domain-containing protein [Micromonospora sp. BRA006-A]